MNRSIFYVVVLLVSANCRGVQSQTFRFDCRLFEKDFEELIYVKNTSIESSFKGYYEEEQNGVFFISRYYGHSDFEKVIFLKIENDRSTLIDLLKKRETSIGVESSQPFIALFQEVERGNYTQACSDGPSEGSISVLLVKAGGAVVFKYEASQYDYTHLNNDEKGRIKNALALIDLLVEKSR